MTQVVSRRLLTRVRPGSVHVVFAVDSAAFGQVSLRVLRFYPVNIISLHSILTHVPSGEGAMGPLATTVPQRHSLTQS
jgi:hypothetical protein